MSTPTRPTTTGTAGVPTPRSEADPAAIRPFQVHVPDEELAELRRRIAATRWPTRELVDDRSQGVQLAVAAGARPLLGDRVRPGAGARHG